MRQHRAPSKIAYDSAWHTYSPGRTLVLLTIERAFQEGITRYELMTGRGSWKEKLTNGKVTVWNAVIPFNGQQPEHLEPAINLLVVIRPCCGGKHRVRPTVTHVITDLGAGRAGRLLKSLVLSDQGRRASRHVVIALTDRRRHGDVLREADVELYCLELSKLSQIPVAFFRLSTLLRKIRPDVVMTWRYGANLMGTVAAITSGIGTRRVVWNLSGSIPSSPGYAHAAQHRLLAWLSPMPSAAVSDSQSGQLEHEALGYRPRRWVQLPNNARTDKNRETLKSNRDLWRQVSRTARRSRFQTFRWRWQVYVRRVSARLRVRAAQLRRLYLTKTTFIAVTGSCGKTTTVSLASAILSATGRRRFLARPGHNVVRSSVRTVLRVPASSQYCIQEVSAHPPGSIATHTRVLKPRIAVVTTVGYDHYKSLRGPENTAKEKGILVEGLPRRGIAILNADDPHVRAMADRTHARVLLFGFSPDADIRATEVSSVWPDCLSLTVLHGNERQRIQTRTRW